MPRLFLFAALFLLASPLSVTAQTYETQSAPLATSEVNAPEASGATQAAERLLTNFDLSTVTPTTRTYAFGGQSGAGYVFGTGPASFKVAQSFAFPNTEGGTVLGADVYFYAKSVTPTMDEYQVEVWSGGPQSGPQAELYSESFPISEIQLNNAGPVPTQVRFTTPLPVGDETFFIVLPFDESSVGDSLAIVSTQQLSPTLAPESWHFVNSAWSLTSQIFSSSGTPLQSYAWIQAFVDDTPVSRESLPDGLSSVRLFPNPAPEASAVEVDLSRASGVRVTVVDLLGREVSRAFSGALPAGRRVLDLGIGGLPAATYAVRVEIDGVPVTRLLSVTR